MQGDAVEYSSGDIARGDNAPAMRRASRASTAVNLQTQTREVASLSSHFNNERWIRVGVGNVRACFGGHEKTHNHSTRNTHATQTDRGK